ncbi:hypothetical protein RND81_04G229600 [Saponaria officinalis]|uniref:Polygalacturonase n=1 Tax=Saponaria officinalis TaxID=3572 RepID=A0AAW1LP70_SAPOF
MTNLFFVLFLSSLIHSHTSSASHNNSFLTRRFTSAPSAIVKKYNVVRHFGANNDGKTDTTQPFLNAWNAACSKSIPVQITVPMGYYFLNPLIFKGPCKSSVSFIIGGKFFTGNNYSSNHWISFMNVDGLLIKGGVLDANGKKLWDCKNAGRSCPKGAMSLSFISSKNIVIDGLTSANSQMFHIGMHLCENINMQGITISADGNSPNTDGIHLQDTKGVTITNSRIMTGDDCISMAGGIQNVWIENIFCGPGHACTIGSLGHDGEEGILVQNVTVKSTTFVSTQNGVRIKTLSTPINGNVKDIYFLGAIMKNARNPIFIDQNYCPSNTCEKGQGSGIQISNVVYKDIHGTSSSANIVIFNCSPKKPCNTLQLQDVKLSYQSGTSKYYGRFMPFFKIKR